MTNKWIRVIYMLAVTVVCMILPTPSFIGEMTGFTTITMETFFFPAIIYLITVCDIKSIKDLKEIPKKSWTQKRNILMCFLVMSFGTFSVVMGVKGLFTMNSLFPADDKIVNDVLVKNKALLGWPCSPWTWHDACAEISTGH